MQGATVIIEPLLASGSYIAFNERWWILLLISETKTTYPYGDWFDQEVAEKLYSDRMDLNKKAVMGFWFLSVYTSINIFLFGLVEKYTEGNDAFMFFPCWVSRAVPISGPETRQLVTWHGFYFSGALQPERPC